MKVLLIAFLVVLIGFVSRIDYLEEVKKENHYRIMVCQGHWPDYKELKLPCEESK